jgi:predicted glycogen debranching enzyme
MDDNLHGGVFEATILPGESFTFVASIDATPNLDGTAAFQQRKDEEQQLLMNAAVNGDVTPAVKQLVLAANQFIIKRPIKDNHAGRSVIAGYHWFIDWGRDTLISLPGLMLVTGRSDIAAGILRTFAFYVKGGMLPNRFPDADSKPEYSMVDLALWYFEAMRAYHAVTGDDEFVRQLFSVLADIIAQHKQGTLFNIHLDPEDGLLYAIRGSLISIRMKFKIQN